MYGETAGTLRAELTILLRQHRIQQRIGGEGTHTVPVTNTPGQRDQLGQQIRRYRHGVLLWCHQAVAAVNPTAQMLGPGGTRGPAAELHFRLGRTMAGSASGLAPLDELATGQGFDLVEHWRNAARAAALGEHDFAADINSGHLDRDQCLTVTRDAVEVVRALIVLDRRYSNIPGWEHLTGTAPLGRAATAAAAPAGNENIDLSVDRYGWRSPRVPINSPARPGIAGVVQAELNVLVGLQQFPAALNLKRVLDSQRELSHLLAGRVSESDPPLSEKWAARAQTYTALFAETRNIGGLVGDGHHAAAEGTNALSRLRTVDPTQPLDVFGVRDLDRVFNRIDARLVDVFEHGINARLYFIKAKVPRIDDLDRNVVHGVRERFMPITSPVQTDLVSIVRERLRPPPEPSAAPTQAAQTRSDLEEAIEHRPDGRATGSAISI